VVHIAIGRLTYVAVGRDDARRNHGESLLEGPSRFDGSPATWQRAKATTIW
jgi:hypothetical protein